MPHIYEVGQMLELSSAPLHSNRPKGLCKILACLPHERGPNLYRVQCLSERNERVVEEADLSPSAKAKSTVAKNEGFLSVAIVNRR